MMGKRVNYAARSVISPDPRLLPREVGIPPYFAVRLSVPERVTEANAKELRKAVRSGAREHPGALAVEDEQGRVVSLIGLTAAKRDALARSLLARKSSAVVVGKGASAAAKMAPGGGGKVSAAAGATSPSPAAAATSSSFDPAARSKIVYRHLRDGDVVLTNRQPTLHRPGLVAHRCRVLSGERTIRLHYANCAAFNADFDGDEINLHAPQDLLGRAEARELVGAERQFVVPTDGKPVRGLIQDAVVAGTRLCCRGELLGRDEAAQLLWNAVAPRLPGDDGARMPFVRLPPPAILKALPPGSLPPAAPGAPAPRSDGDLAAPLWTGKQIIDAILAFVAAGRPPLTVCYAAKVPADAWPGGLAFGAAPPPPPAAGGGGGGGRGRARPPFRLNPSAAVDLGEGSVLVLRGRLLTGTLDKACYGRGGLVHAVHEVYGALAADDLLAALSRAGGCFLERRGFSCGVGDLLLTAAAEREREGLLGAADGRARRAAVDFAASRGHAEAEAEEEEGGGGGGGAGPPDRDASLRAALAALARASGGDADAALDACVTAPLNGLASDVIRACLPRGLALPFPRNCLSMMTTTGAKGSGVNFSQISCLLGQQELEGRRVPRSAAGRTLPCFAPFDPSARAGGFVADRFLSGLRPQEYYFHCMAGREGLVDTTVKTARSGYLQRCLVKCLEPLSGAYDGTVRDGADSSVVQFAYGDGDGRDVAGASLLRDFRLAAANAPALALGLRAREAFEASAEASPAARARASGEGPEATSPAFEAALEAFMTEAVAPSGVRDSVVGGAGAVAAEAATRALAAAAAGDGWGASEPKGEPKRKTSSPPLTFADLARVRFFQAALSPGEAVGVLAAQSIGEPSTQMTLNTFHMAGRGDANVTMGVPRLRELFMTASPHAATPSMDLPLPGPAASGAAGSPVGDEAAERLVRRLRRVRLAEALSGIEVTEAPAVESAASGFGSGARRRSRCYRVTLTLLPASAGVPSFETLEATFREKFVPALVGAVAAELRRAATGAAAAAVVAASAAGEEEGGAPAAAAVPASAAAASAGGDGDDVAERSSVPNSKKKKQPKQSKDGEDEDAEADADFVDAKTAARGGGGLPSGGGGSSSKVNRERDAGYGVPDEEEAEELAAGRRPSISPSPAGSDDDGDGGEDAAAAAAAARRRPSSSTPSIAAAAAAASRAASKAAAAAAGVDAGEPSADEAARALSLELRVPPSAPRLLLLQLAERAAASPASDVSAVPGVERAALVVARNGSRLVRCEGVNLFGAFEAAIAALGSASGGGAERNASSAAAVEIAAAADAVAAATTTNDVGASLRALGVEAARATLVAQASALFGAYGIGVDARHLGLIADFMTRRGGYSPCNRLGIDSSASPLLRVSFETAASFLAAATLSGEADALRSPAARIALGRPVGVGTGCFGLRQRL